MDFQPALGGVVIHYGYFDRGCHFLADLPIRFLHPDTSDIDYVVLLGQLVKLGHGDLEVGMTGVCLNVFVKGDLQVVGQREQLVFGTETRAFMLLAH